VTYILVIIAGTLMDWREEHQGSEPSEAIVAAGCIGAQQ
jgi:hypothetical protein